MNNQDQKHNERKPQGTVTIENKNPEKVKNNKNDDGDYVDYEEVK